MAAEGVTATGAQPPAAEDTAHIPWPEHGVPDSAAWIAPERAIGNVHDVIALVRAYLAGDGEAAYTLLSLTTDPRGCMAALATLTVGILTRLGVGRDAAGPLLDDMSRELEDLALDLFATPLTRDQRQGAR